MEEHNRKVVPSHQPHRHRRGRAGQGRDPLKWNEDPATQGSQRIPPRGRQDHHVNDKQICEDIHIGDINLEVNFSDILQFKNK